MRPLNAIGHENDGKAKAFGTVQRHDLDGVDEASWIFARARVISSLGVVADEPAEALDVLEGAVASGSFIIRDCLTQAAQIVHLDLVLIGVVFSIINTEKHQDIPI